MVQHESILVLEVDLQCSKCYNKARKILCQNHYRIRSQAIDMNASTITITGPFDPIEFAKHLHNKAGNVIKGIEIKKREEKPKAKEAEQPKAKEPEKPKAKEPEKPKAKEAEKPKAKEPEKPKAKEAEKPKVKESDAKGEKPKQVQAKKDDKPKKADEKPKRVNFKSDPPNPYMPKLGPGLKFIDPSAHPMVHYTLPVYEGYIESGPGYDYGWPVGYAYGYGAASTYNEYNYNSRNLNHHGSVDYDYSYDSRNLNHHGSVDYDYSYDSRNLNHHGSVDCDYNYNRRDINHYESDDHFSETDPSCTIM